jgi:hypothetical protein
MDRKMNDLKNMQIKTLSRFLLYFAVFTIILVLLSLLLCRYGYGTGLREDGIIEWFEFLWLCISSLFLFLAARRTNEYASLFSVLWIIPLIAGIRELDAVFDSIFHGAWVIPAAAISMVVFYRIFKSFGQIKIEALRFTQTQQVVFLGIGFFIVVVFSRVCGEQAVWNSLLGEHYIRKVGRFIEEYLEFFGYVIIIIGSLECYLSSGLGRTE